MKLVDFLKNYVLSGENILVYAELDVGTNDSFMVEIMRGWRNEIDTPGWRDEYKEWLSALNLEVDTVSACKQDTSGNKDMLCIKCKPIKLLTIRGNENGEYEKD